MKDRGLIIAGLVIFVVLMTFPIWYNLAVGEATTKLDLAPADKGDRCVLERAEMRANHMDILNRWRDDVVRIGERIYKSPDGTEYNMSLTNTCLDCHTQKDKFCDRCHNYLSVDPYCWSCHIIPEGGGK